MTDRVKPDTLEPIPPEYQKGEWAPVAYTTEEGGDWINILGRNLPSTAKAIAYENGWIFDFILLSMNLNPWRHKDDTP